MRKLLMYLSVVVLVSAAAVRVQAQACETYCTESSNCAARCIVDPQDWPRTWTTCAAWGTCCYWLESERVEIGRHQSGAPPAYCDYWVSYRITEYKICDPNQTRTRCEDVKDGWGVGINCCGAWGCWGQQC